MADIWTPQPAFAQALLPGRYGHSDGPPGLIVQRNEVASAAIVLARKGQIEALAEKVMQAHKISLPLAPQCVASGGSAWTALSPGQWLVTGVKASELFAAITPLATVSDQSDARAFLRLSGPKVLETLAKGVPLDLHPDSFAVGAAAASVVALISTWLWKLDDSPTFQVAVPRSMAGSFAEWLTASAAEFGMAVE